MPSHDLFKRRRFEGAPLYLVGIAVALGVHGAASVGASRLPTLKQAVRVVMDVVKKAPPPPPPPVVPKEEPKPEPPKPKPPPPKAVVQKPVPPPPNAPPPPPNAPPPTEAPQKPVPIVTGISLGSTVSGGAGVSVRVGNTLYGDVNKEKFVDPNAVKPYAGPYVYTPAKSFEITEEPSIEREVKGEFPEAAKRAGVQGTVVLKVEVQSNGLVRSVVVVKGLGYGLDEVAVASMKKFKFKPAKVNGKPVDYTISRFNYVFEMVD